MDDTEAFGTRRKAYMHCDICGDNYYIEATNGSTLENWKCCPLCLASYHFLSFLDKDFDKGKCNGGEIINVHCSECRLDFKFRNGALKDKLVYCGFCESRTVRLS